MRIEVDDQGVGDDIQQRQTVVVADRNRCDLQLLVAEGVTDAALVVSISLEGRWKGSELVLLAIKRIEALGLLGVDPALALVGLKGLAGLVGKATLIL